jgi:hypothetical protein
MIGSADESGGNLVNAGSINLSAGNNGGSGGSIIANGNGGHSGGTLNISGGSGANGGSINTSGNQARGGSINLSGGTLDDSADGGNISLMGNRGAAGSINLSASTTNSVGGGGSIISTGVGDQSGGSINMSGGADGAGGSIITINDGGDINTTGTGSIGLGKSDTRTTLTGTATQSRSISLPDASGTIALLSNFLGAFKDAVVLAPSADMSVTSSTTLADITGMSWTAAANTSYLCACAWQVDCGAGGFQMVLDCPSVYVGGSSLPGYGLTVNGANTVAGLSQGGASEVRAGNRGAAQTGPVFSIFAFRTSSTGGTAKFRFAQNGSNAAASVLKAQSRVLVLPMT